MSAGLSVPTTTVGLGRNSTQPAAIGATGSLSSLPAPAGQISKGGTPPPSNVTVNGCPCTCQCPSGAFSLSGSSQIPATPLSVASSASAPLQGSLSKTTLQTVVSNATEVAGPASVPTSPSPGVVSSTSLAGAQLQTASPSAATITVSSSGLNLQTFSLQTAITVPLNLGSSSTTAAG